MLPARPVILRRPNLSELALRMARRLLEHGVSPRCHILLLPIAKLVGNLHIQLYYRGRVFLDPKVLEVFILKSLEWCL